MNKPMYTLIRIEYNHIGTSCEECGRYIKNIAYVRDNMTNKVLKVGTTCINKLMKLNKKSSDLLQKRIKDYQRRIEYNYTVIAKINNIEEYIEAKLIEGKEYSYNKDSYSYQPSWIVVREAIQNISFAYSQLIKVTKELDNLSKTLIQLEELEILEEQHKAFKERFKTEDYKNTWKHNLDNEEGIKELLKKYNY